MGRGLSGFRGVLAMAVACASTLVGGGCATPPGAIFESASAGPFWPSPPDRPRLRYLGQVRGEADLRPGKSGLQRLGESLFGAKPTESFVSPMSACTDGGNRLFIADAGEQAIHVLDLDSRKYTRWAPTEPGERLTQPVAVAFEPLPAPGRLLVADSAAGEVVVFDTQGHRTATMGTNVLRRPCGIAVDTAARRIFVADAGLHQIVVLGDDGKELVRIGRRGSGPGEFNFPTNVALDADGRLIVSDSLNFRVQIFGSNFEFVKQIGRKGDMPGYFAQPKGVAVDALGRIYVVDANFEAVQLFDRDGTLLMSFGREGHGPGEFWLPAGVSVDPQGRIWVADSYNRRVQAFECLPEEKTP
jgi:DNA-binding beta-propeller fold protein YncE